MSTANFETEVLESEQPVIVDFWAAWCGPCRALGPTLGRLAAEHANELRVVKVNVDEEHALARRYGVRTIPTLILFSRGQPVARSVGAKPKWMLERSLGLTSVGAAIDGPLLPRRGLLAWLRPPGRGRQG